MAEPLFISSDIPLIKPHFRLILNSVLHVLCLALIVVIVALPEWFSYCEFHWNLYLSKTNTSAKDRISGSWIADVHKGLCGDFSPVINGVCKDFCGNTRLLEIAGIIMLAYLVVCFLLSLVYIGVNLVLLKRGFLKSKVLYVTSTQHGLWAQSLLYLSGLVLYLAIGNVYGLNHPTAGASGFEHKPGLILAYVGYGLMLATSLQGYLQVGPLFQGARKDQFDYLRS